MRIIVTLGARPCVIKAGTLLPEFARAGIEVDVAFTGSRSAERMLGDPSSTLSFYGLEFPAPRWFLDVGSSNHTTQTGRAMVAFERLFAEERPDAVLVIGDVVATLAAALAAAAAHIDVIHLDAGLRCGDLRLPEEMNRVLVSKVSAMHLTPTEQALENLEDEGVDPERIHFVGNTMAESVIRNLDLIGHVDPASEFRVTKGGYILGCFHRAENVGDAGRLAGILAGLSISPLPVVVPDSNGFRQAMAAAGLDAPATVRIVDAVDYRLMLALERDAAAIVTDSSGVQEEACTLCTPCVTVRECTEQVATLEAGANVLVAAEGEAIRAAISDAIGRRHRWAVPKRWDGAVSDRVVRAIKRGVIPLS